MFDIAFTINLIARSPQEYDHAAKSEIRARSPHNVILI